jgi:hypothetical protein
VPRFEGVLTRGERGGHLVEIPLDVPAVFGQARAPVRVTINGHSFRTRVATYGGKYYLGLNREVRDAAGVADGDKLTIDIERDDAPREVEVPPDLAKALKAGLVRATFDALSFTHRKEYVRWIEEAKREETRQRRLKETVEMLRRGVNTPG